jgi:hypothetical protein
MSAEQNYHDDQKMEISNIERAKAQLAADFCDRHPSPRDDDDTTMYHLKPALQEGDEVWAGWWGENDTINTIGAKWYPGTVHAVREVDQIEDSRADKYGPIRVYDIHYEDGDISNGVLDAFVLPKKEYLFHVKKPIEGLWKGVRPKTDKSSSDWYARELGFYATTIDGEEQIFSTLHEAMKKADEQIILRKNGNVRKSDLNLPEECNLLKKRKKKRERSNAGADEKPKKKATKKMEPEDYSSDDTGSYFDEDMEEESEDESTDVSFQDDDDEGSRVHSQGGGEQSRYTGVVYIKSTNRYRGIIRINQQNQQLGNYILGADAANACDEYCRTMNISDRAFNFNTEKEYKDARSKEILRRRLTLEEATTLAQVMERIQVFKEKWSSKRRSKKKTRTNHSSSHSDSNDDLSLPSVGSDLSPLVPSTTKASVTFTPHVLTERKQRSKQPSIENIWGSSNTIADLNENLTRKWNIPADGNVFLDSYQRSLAEILGASNDRNNRDNSIETIVSISTRKPIDVQSENEDDLNYGERNEVKYTGVTILKGKNRFRGTVCINSKQKSVGDFLLKADAARARDEFCRSFNLNSRAFNFNTDEEYENARTQEIAQRRLTMDDADTLAKKKDVMSLSEVAAKLQTKKAIWREESRQTITVTGVDDSPQNFNRQPLSILQKDDADGVLSDAKGDQEDFDSTAITPDWSQMKLHEVTKEQEGSLHFPVGCRVLWKLQDESFHRGVVSSAWLDMNPPIKVVYEVDTLNGESKQKKIDSELAFDTHCLVYIKSSGTDASLVEGEVLFSRRDNNETFYTVQIEKEGNEFQIMHDVPANLVQCRRTHSIDIELPLWLVYDIEAEARLKGE